MELESLGKNDAAPRQLAAMGIASRGLLRSFRRIGGVLAALAVTAGLALVPAGAQSSDGAPVFAVALRSSLADVGAATLLVAADQADTVLTVAAPDATGAAAAGLVTEHGASGLVLVGGPAAVGPTVEAELTAAAPQAAVSRVWGADRTATAAEVARRVLTSRSDQRGAVVALANGWSPADAAAAAAAVAAAAADAVLWTSPEALGDAAAGVLEDFEVGLVLVVGGPAALSDDIAAAAGAAAGATVQRVGGATRADTAESLARTATAGRASAVAIADGWDLHAASTAATLAAAVAGAVVLFAEPDGNLGAAATRFLAGSLPEHVWVLGSDEAARTALADNAKQAAPLAQIVLIDSPAAATQAAIEASRQLSQADDDSVSNDGGSDPPPTTQAQATVPPSPTGVTATPQGPSTVLLSWDPYPTDHSVVELTVVWYRSSDPAGTPPAGGAILAPSATTYTVTGLIPGTRYQLNILARSTSGLTRGTAVFATTPQTTTPKTTTPQS